LLRLLLRISLPNQFELENRPSLLGMVEEGRGGAITGPFSFMRAKRYQGRIALHLFPGKDFSRTLSLFTTDVYAQLVVKIVPSDPQRLLK